jgi:hypothetical protein
MELLLNTGKETKDMRIVLAHNGVDWNRVWTNLHNAALPPPVLSTWYLVINDILPTNVRLAAIRIAPSNTCAECGHEDTLTHRMVACKEGRVI